MECWSVIQDTRVLVLVHFPHSVAEQVKHLKLLVFYGFGNNNVSVNQLNIPTSAEVRPQ